jgi:archaellum component FlaC
MANDGDVERRLAELESRCRDIEAALSTLIDSIVGQVDIQAETARSIERLGEEVMRLRACLGHGSTSALKPAKPDLQSIPGGKPDRDRDG